jgi:uncharacterized protein YlxW (UPF0749 family)
MSDEARVKRMLEIVEERDALKKKVEKLEAEVAEQEKELEGYRTGMTCAGGCR